jgi:archaellum biogenesis protein FlaJ (TadC family)
MTHLPPAYRGAPYHQPSPQTRRQRAVRALIIVAIIIGALLLLVLIGAAIAPVSLL